MDLWIEGDVQSGTETKWVAQVVVYDGNKIVKGHMELGKVAPEPTGGSAEIAPYKCIQILNCLAFSICNCR